MNEPDNTPASETPDEQVPDKEPSASAEGAEDTGDDVAALRREAANYRRQLRGAEG
jgi:hypothetical protein